MSRRGRAVRAFPHVAAWNSGRLRGALRPGSMCVVVAFRLHLRQVDHSEREPGQQFHLSPVIEQDFKPVHSGHVESKRQLADDIDAPIVVAFEVQRTPDHLFGFTGRFHNVDDDNQSLLFIYSHLK